MKACWQFYFECEGVQFERVYEFEALFSKDDAEAFGLGPEAFEAIIRIEPDDEKSINPRVDQTGKMKITLPGDNESTKELAVWLAENAAQQITFSQGRMRVHYGLMMGEHLPDTPEEAQSLGEGRWFAEAHLREVRPPAVFNGDALEHLASSRLIQQFNEADNARNPIDSYLGMFRIIEDLYGPSTKKTSLAEALKSSDEFFRIAQKQIHLTRGTDQKELTRAAFFKIVDLFVRTRHECAQLRTKSDFGIMHGDPQGRKRSQAAREYDSKYRLRVNKRPLPQLQIQ